MSNLAYTGTDSELIPWQPCEANSWKRMQAKRAFEVVLGKMLQPVASSPDEEEVPYLKALHVNWGRIVLNDLPTMWAAPGEIEQLKLIIGDLLVCEGGEVGRAARLTAQPPEKCIIQNALHRVRSSRNMGHVGFLGYCLQHASENGWFDVLCNRATIAHFTVEKFRDLWLYLPPVEVQRHIADYLDAETTQIDALIAEKERMLSLLEEKRAALISRAVTRGLDPNVQMKPSGLDWLGDIPAHWELKRLRHLLKSLTQGWSPIGANYPTEIDNWGVLKLSAVSRGEFKPHENKALSDDIQIPGGLDLQPDDLLLTRSNTPSLVGDVAVVNQKWPQLLLPDLIYRLRFDKSVIVPDFVKYFLLTPSGRAQIESDARGSSGSMVKISQDHIKDWFVPVPPLDEQSTIATALAQERARTAELETSLHHSISLLKERRRSLITEAVTGKLEPETVPT